MKTTKLMKKTAILLGTVFLISMISGCGSFNASNYLKAVLDNSYKNDSTGYVDQKIATKEEAAKIYNDDLDKELNGFVSNATITISDDVKENIRNVFADLFKAANYTVKDAKKQSDGSYEVTVEYKTLNVFKKAYSTYSTNIKKIDSKKLNSQQEMYDKIYQTLADAINDELKNPEYSDTQTIDITVTAKDNVYSPDEDDLYKLKQGLFDISEFGK